jgi:polyhydroxyalkanoate synthesis regulator phasin
MADKERDARLDELRAAIEKTFSAVSDSASGTRERAQDLLDDAVRLGQEAREGAARRGKEAREEARKRGQDARDAVTRRSKDAMDRIEKELEVLRKRISELESALARSSKKR